MSGSALGVAALHRKMEALQAENEHLTLRMKYLQTVGDVYRKKIRLLIDSASPADELAGVLTGMHQAENSAVSTNTMSRIVNDPDHSALDEIAAAQRHADVGSYWKDQFLGLVKDTTNVDDALLVRRLVGEKEELARRLSACEMESAAVRSRNEALEEEIIRHSRSIKECERRTAEQLVTALQNERAEAESAHQRESRRKLTALQARLNRAEDSTRAQEASFQSVTSAMRLELDHQQSLVRELTEKLSESTERALAAEKSLSLVAAQVEKEKVIARSAEASAAAAGRAAMDGASESRVRTERLREQLSESIALNDKLSRDLTSTRDALTAANLKLKLAALTNAGQAPPPRSAAVEQEASSSESSPQHLLTKLSRAVQSVESQNFTLGGGLRDLSTQLDSLESVRRDATMFQERSSLLQRQLRILRDECTRAAKLHRLDLLEPESLQRALMAAALPNVDETEQRESFVQEKDGFRMFRDHASGDVFFVTTNPLDTPFGPQERVLRQHEDWSEILVTKTRAVLYTTTDIDSTPFGAPREVVVREYKGFRETLRRDLGSTVFVTDDINRTSFGVPCNETVLREADGVAEVLNTDTDDTYFKTKDVRWTPFHKREVELRQIDGFTEVLRDDGRTVYVTEDKERTPFGEPKVHKTCVWAASQTDDLPVAAPSAPALTTADREVQTSPISEEEPKPVPCVTATTPPVVASFAFHIARCAGLALQDPDSDQVFVIARDADGSVLVETPCAAEDSTNPSWDRADALFEVSVIDGDAVPVIRLEVWTLLIPSNEKSCFGVAHLPVQDVMHEDSGSRSYQLELCPPRIMLDEAAIIFVRFARAS